MYSYFIGKVTENYINKISFLVNDIAFEVNVMSNETFNVGETIKLHIFDIIKEDRILLYGFKEKKQLNLFNKLLLVNGIGVKKSIQILSNASIDRIIYLIKNKDINSLRKINGVGNKAEAIVFSLFNKIDINKEDCDYRYKNVYSALSNLGFEEKEINNALKKVEDNLTDEDALKCALKEMNNGIIR